MSRPPSCRIAVHAPRSDPSENYKGLASTSTWLREETCGPDEMRCCGGTRGIKVTAKTISDIEFGTSPLKLENWRIAIEAWILCLNQGPPRSDRNLGNDSILIHTTISFSPNDVAVYQIRRTHREATATWALSSIETLPTRLWQSMTPIMVDSAVNPQSV